MACFTNTLRLASRRILTSKQGLHTSSAVGVLKTHDGMYNVTMVPGDGVGEFYAEF